MPANPIFTDESNAILVNRLARVSSALRALTLSTAEAFEAQIFSDVNAVLSLGEVMTPLHPVGAEGPAIVGDVIDNYTILNNDAGDISAELLRQEDDAASAFNLSASSQNQLRQLIRERIYASNKKRYIEDFLNQNHLTNVTANLDFAAGVATCPLNNGTTLTPTITIGNGSVGSLADGSSVGYLTDGLSTTALTWNGTSLELILSFPQPRIMNRLEVVMDNYEGLEIDTFFTTPDGTLVEDVLSDLFAGRIIMDATSGKYSGAVIVDFPPRHVSVARIVINDRVGDEVVALRALSVSQRNYSSSGILQAGPISAPTGSVLFTTLQDVFSPYVSIVHQISYDGANFTSITPSSTINLAASPFWYRATLLRNKAAFHPQQGPLNQSPLDPVQSAYYTVQSTMTTPIGNGSIQRSLQLSNITGAIVFRETPTPGTLTIQAGSVILNQADGDYAFTNNTLSFPTSQSAITISYQTTALGAAAVADREDYYTPLLYSFRFEAT